MYVINARNVHEALPMLVHYIYRYGIKKGEDCLVTPSTVTICYQLPGEMCTFHPDCKINPFDVLLNGLNTVDTYSQQNSDYSFFLQTNVYDALDLMVFNPSANVMETKDLAGFAMLLQYEAAEAGVVPGRVWRTNTGYYANIEALALRGWKDLQNHARSVDLYADRIMSHSPYETGSVQPFNIMQGVYPENMGEWDSDLKMFLQEQDGALGYRTTFFKKVAVPMMQAYNAFGEDGKEQALQFCKSIRATDWRLACEMWIDQQSEG